MSSRCISLGTRTAFGFAPGLEGAESQWRRRAPTSVQLHGDTSIAIAAEGGEGCVQTARSLRKDLQGPAFLG